MEAGPKKPFVDDGANALQYVAAGRLGRESERGFYEYA